MIHFLLAEEHYVAPCYKVQVLISRKCQICSEKLSITGPNSDGSWNQSSLLFKRYEGLFSQIYIVRSVKLTTSLHLVTKLRMHGTLPPVLFNVYVFTVWHTNFKVFSRFLYIHTKSISEISSGWIETENLTPRLQDAGKATCELNTETHAVWKQGVDISSTELTKRWPFITKDSDILWTHILRKLFGWSIWDGCNGSATHERDK
jgi:hypothetical protein